MRSIATTTLAGLLIAASAPPFVAGADTVEQEIRALRSLIDELDQKLRILERRQELKDEAATAAASSISRITVNDRGFTLAAADGAHSLRLRGLVQADSRWYFGDDPGLTNNDAFVLRRARLIFEGQFNQNTTFVVAPELAGSSPTLLDAYVNLALSPGLQFRAGRFKEPVGLEQLQSDSTAFFAERSVVSQLVPNRDIGIQVSGDLRGGTISYAAGLFNGVVDGGNNGPVVNADADKDKDVAARVFLQPFRNDTNSALRGLGFGIGASSGRERPAAGVASYRTDGQQTAFAYRAQNAAAAASPTNFTTVIDGRNWRISPQAYYYHGPLGILGEYAVSVVNVRPNFPANFVGSPRVELRNKAWQLAGSYVLTSENASYSGVVPRRSFNLSERTWGAFELVARFAQLDIDDAAFVSPGDGYASLADPAANPTKLSTFGLGLNWYLQRSLRASLNYFHTEFDNNVAVPSRLVLRKDESAVLSRVQLAF